MDKYSEFLKSLSQDVIDHCKRHSMCKGCPLGTCVAPLVNADDPRWKEWLDGRAEAVRALSVDGAAAGAGEAAPRIQWETRRAS